MFTSVVCFSSPASLSADSLKGDAPRERERERGMGKVWVVCDSVAIRHDNGVLWGRRTCFLPPGRGDEAGSFDWRAASCRSDFGVGVGQKAEPLQGRGDPPGGGL